MTDAQAALYAASQPAHAAYAASIARCERRECGRDVDSPFCRCTRKADRALAKAIRALPEYAAAALEVRS